MKFTLQWYYTIKALTNYVHTLTVYTVTELCVVIFGSCDYNLCIFSKLVSVNFAANSKVVDVVVLSDSPTCWPLNGLLTQYGEIEEKIEVIGETTTVTGCPLTALLGLN